MFVAPNPLNASRAGELDKPPARPTGSEGRNMMELSATPAPSGDGLGDSARAPKIQVLQGLAMAKAGFNLISVGLPPLAQLLAATITDLEQLIPQAMADQLAGTMPTAPPGMSPGGPAGPMGPPQPMGGPPMAGGPQPPAGIPPQG